MKRLALICAICTILSAAHLRAAPIFFDNEADWLAAALGVESFPLTAANIGTATELPGAPGSDTSLGTDVLTFAGANSGLSWDFSAAVLAGRDWVFEDRSIADTLSPGDLDSSRDHDDGFSMTVLGGPALHGFAFDLFSNDVTSPTESLEVFAPGGALLASFALPTDPGFTFVGVLSDMPIGSVVMNEDLEPGEDDVLLAHFRFAAGSNQPVGIPAPGTLLLLAVGLLGLCGAARRQSRRVD